MFATDKELKAKKSKGAKSTAAASREDVVERARQQREERERMRTQQSHAIKICAVVRGFLARRRTKAAFTQELDSKMGDIGKVKQLLKSKGVPFLTPVDAVLRCLRLTRVLDPSKPQDALRLSRLWDELIADYLHPEKSQQLAGLLDVLLSQHYILIRSLRQSFMCLQPQTSESGFLSFLIAISGCSSQSHLQDARLIEKVDRLLLEALDVFAVGRSHIMRLLNRSRQQIMRNIQREEDDLQVMHRPYALTGEYSPAADAVFAWLSVYTRRMPQQLAPRFVSGLLTIPMLTSGLSLSTCELLIRTGLLPVLLPLCADVTLDSVPSVLPSYRSTTWLLGNLVSVASGAGFGIVQRAYRVAISDSEPASAEQDGSFIPELLLDSLSVPQQVLVLETITQLARMQAAPGLLSGTQAVQWAKVGVVHEAMSPPVRLRQQLGGLVAQPFVAAWYLRSIAPISEQNLQRPMRQEHLAAVQEAKNSTALEYARQSVIELQQQSALSSIGSMLAPRKWMSSRYAERLWGGAKSMSIFRWFKSGEGDGETKVKDDAAEAAAQTEADGQLAMIEEVSSPTGKTFAFEPALTASWCDLYALIVPYFYVSSIYDPHSSRQASMSTHGAWRLINYLCFSTHCTRKLWAYARMQRLHDVEAFCQAFDPSKSFEVQGLLAVLSLLNTLLSQTLVATDDVEMYDRQRPFPLHNFVSLVSCMKSVLYDILRYSTYLFDASAYVRSPRSQEQQGEVSVAGAARTSFAVVLASLMRSLYDRCCRRPFCGPSTWAVAEADSNRILAALSDRTPFGETLLRKMPYAVKFTERLKLFRHFVQVDRDRHQPEGARPIVIRVRRSMVLEDGLRQLDRSGTDLKQRIAVRYINEFGEEEVGIDMGGLFKDFWTDLSDRIFDPAVGLFRVTSDHLMYPNPAAKMLYPDEYLKLFEFLGRVLGKALYEGITVQPQFAYFFLAFMRSQYNFLDLFNDLSTLDMDLFKNLMFLKTYDGDIADLSLSFVVNDDELSGQQEVELIAGGRSVAVTSANKHRYINLMAKYHLHDKIRDTAEAFVRGLYEIIHPAWLAMFSPPELQIFISGATTSIDVEDWKRHTSYSGGYTVADRHVRRFWEVVEELDANQRARLLRFVTSCQRPPSLGFSALTPGFTIHRVPISNDNERLPTASTCFNILKLPTYSSKSVMRDKLMLALESGAGFDLS